METKVSTVTPRQTVTPNKDIIGEDREDVNRLNKGEANCHVIQCISAVRTSGIIIRVTLEIIINRGNTIIFITGGERKKERESERDRGEKTNRA